MHCSKLFVPLAQPFSLTCFVPDAMFIYNHVFSLTPWPFTLHYLCKGDVLWLGQGGTRIFSQSQMGRPEYFVICKGGHQDFLPQAKEAEKIGDRRSQTDAPLPVNNDSSLSCKSLTLESVLQTSKLIVGSSSLNLINFSNFLTCRPAQ